MDAVQTSLAQITQRINLSNLRITGETDTALFKRAFQTAFQHSFENDYWKGYYTIEIPSGVYNIDDTIFNDTTVSTVTKGILNFKIKGEGYQNTIINFTPSTPKPFILNNDKLGYTIFEGLLVQGNDIGTFLQTNSTSATGGVAQSFGFEHCLFRKLATLIQTTGDMSNSEIYFDKCKIRDCNASSVIFDMQNPQSVNWRFYNTDIETFDGTLFSMTKACMITFYGGSIIPENSAIVTHIPSNADQNSFGSWTSPQINWISTRFEMRGSVKLIKSESVSANFRQVFNTCNMGGQVLTQTSHYAIDVMGVGSLIFNDCCNYSYYKINSVVDNGSSFISPLLLEFNDCIDLTSDILKNSVVNNVGNNGCYPIFSFNNCFIDSIVRLIGFNHYNGNKTYKEHSYSLTPQRDDFAVIDMSIVNTFTIDLPQVLVKDIYFTNIGNPDYGAISYQITFYNSDRSVLLGQDTFINNQLKTTKFNDLFTKFDVNGKLNIDIATTPLQTGNLSITGVLTLNY
jgi:hypothetical protein